MPGLGPLVDFERWAGDLYQTSATEPPLRGAIFTIEQLEVHAKTLATTHVLGRRRGGDQLLKRLADSERLIATCHDLMSEAHAAGRRLTPAAEWLLDNQYLIEEQLQLARRHYPPGYSRQLPQLRDGESANLPRIYEIVLQLILHVDGRVDGEALDRYTTAYQSVTNLTMGELWSVAIMLRLALIENIRRVAVSISWQRAHRDCALGWAKRINESGEKQDNSLIFALADMVRENPPLSTAFVAQFAQSLQGGGSTTPFVLAWLEQRLAEQGQTIEEVVRAESQMQAADQTSMVNCIASLRYVNATEWHDFVETHSATESILRAEPAGVYGRMDFTTRDEYRHVVETLARRWHLGEEEVARVAVELATARHAASNEDVAGHVGYVLVDEGKPHLERTLRGRPRARLLAQRLLRGLTLLAYLGPVALITAAIATPLVVQYLRESRLAWPILVLCAALAASQCAVSMVNWYASVTRRPRSLPRMDFERGIPDNCRTMVVVPTLLTSHKRIAEILESLELRYLANRDPNLWFGLLTDFWDADQELVEGDEMLLQRAAGGIQELNGKYGTGTHGQFFLFHRPRLYNPQERSWMGRERKRGKLEDFNALLCGEDRGRFSKIVGDSSRLTSIRYVITLDTDTDLPWGAGWRLVGAAAHPLNRPVMGLDRRRLVRGYAILQPRVSISLRSAQQSHYSRLLSGEVGLDPYTRVVSDLYQDLFAEASFIGKGIYDVSAFHQLLDRRFPDNTVLSHDLLESVYARSGQCSDVELLEDCPSRYLADVSRRHRWMRGDWQIASWLGVRVSDAAGQRVYPWIAALGWWKIFDNLRRSLVASAYTVLLVLGWIALPAPLFWTLCVLSLLLLPDLLSGLTELMRRPAKLPLWMHVTTVGRSGARRLAKIALWLTFLPFEALVALDAAARSLWRVHYSRHRLLEWQTAATAESKAAADIWRVAQRMWVGPGLAVAVATLLVSTGEQRAAVSASPILLLWLLSPVAAWWVSRPLRSRAALWSDGDARFLRRIARLTWRYFEEFVGPQENWLPPDNFQEKPGHRVAHRTSPTNMGLALLSNLAAHDLGYLTSGQLLERTARTFESMEQLERHRGHFFNWYDTLSRKPLRPFYVSSVDSGNLVGYLRTLRSGLLELRSGPLLPARALEGLRDTFRVLTEQLNPMCTTGRPPGGDPPPSCDRGALEWIDRLLQNQPDGLAATALWLGDLSTAATRMAESFDRRRHPETAWWVSAFDRQSQSFLADLTGMAPWLAASAESVGVHSRTLMAEIDSKCNLLELGELVQQASELRDGNSAADGEEHLMHAFQLGALRISSRIREIEALAERCSGLSDAEFSFLYDKARKLLSIGYWVEDHRLDNGFYDLLASEARLASYAAIASGELPFEHWFALGRRLTTAGGRQALISWSGSMFEYLMPRLVMPGFEGTLLDQTSQAVVARQIDYGRRRGVPWGISESCYNFTDVEGNYQYRAFGVPGLGLQRGLSDDLVVSPYSSALALLVDPQNACRNLQRLADEAYLGPSGFYEAIDFTPARLPEGERAAVVEAFMAHHQGMTLLALEHAVLGPRMQRRFLGNPAFRAATLLLQERIPKAIPLIHLEVRAARVLRRAQDRSAEPAIRVFTTPNTPVPAVHLLSNGRYHVMVSAAGSGYSKWNDLAVTRWREDPTSDTFGVFCYIGDRETKRFWSNSFQPTLHAGSRYEAVFTQGRAEFRRHDDRVETHTEIAVSPDDDLEIRRIKLTNRSATARSLLITSCAEVVLAPGLTDETHRAFSNLFVHTELVPDLGAILMTRRPRSTEEQPPWMFCMLLEAGGGAGACSFESDRALCLGRGRSTRHPAMLDGWGSLSGSAGPVLDPCLAVRRAVELPVDRSAQLDLIIGAAPTREAAVALVLKYQDHRMADRVFEMAGTHSRAILGHLGASEVQARHFEQLASAVIYPVGAYRASSRTLRQNRKGQSGLWRYAISGDLPIVLLRVSDDTNLQLVRDLLMAHAYWRMKGLRVDLVIWNEDVSGYRQTLNDQILGLIAAGTEAQLLDRPGGVFVRHVEQFPEEDRVLLQAVARIVIRDVDGPLDQQLDRWRQSLLPARAPMLTPVRYAPPEERGEYPPKRDLIFFNGTGGFTRDGREYIVELAPGRHTPAPWVNVIANPRLGTVVSESGSAYTWFGNAQMCRLTPWSNDPVGDASGEALYIRDDSSGRFFSPTPWPRNGRTAYACRHGFGYSIFEHGELGLESELTTYVAVNAPVKFLSLKIKNVSASTRAVSVFAAVDLVLGDLRPRQAMHVVTELEPLTGAILARNSYNREFSDGVAFLDCSETLRTVSGDRAEFLGLNGDPSSPAGLRLRRLSGRLGAGLDPCAAMQVRLELAEGEQREVVFVLGAGGGVAEAISLVQSHRGVGAARVALEEVWRFWNDKLGVLYAETPDAAINVLMNGWLPYQVLSCRMWGRSGFYQSGGAYGFRDQLQDCVAVLHEIPALSRQHLVRCAERQYVEGDVQHWWQPPSGRGVRTRCSDDFLWLPYAACRYVDFTGDTGVLDEKVPYLTGRALYDGEESYYDLPGRSEQTGTLYEHCTRAILNGLKFGAHGLPLMGSGDWNDGMNRVGRLGQGESVWLAFFLHDVLSRFAALADRRGDSSFAERCRATASELAGHIEKHGWDGQWYRRAYFDNGEPLGSALNLQCQIDSLPQSWATISGAGEPERCRQSLDAVWDRLVRKDLRIVQLFTPPFDHSTLDPGYIAGYPPGVRENAGQYTHGAVWTALAFALAGRSEQASTLVSMLNPITHALDPQAVERYRVEPYVLAADVYSQSPHAGRGGWTWYTGSAGWFYRLFHEVILGIERQVDVLRFRPRVPASWTSYKVHYRYYQTFYHIVFRQDQAHQGPTRLTLDGRRLREEDLKLVNDKREHTVELRFGPGPVKQLHVPGEQHLPGRRRV